MPKEALPVRLFRSDTPHDVASAAIVAGTLAPGRNILAFTTYKSAGRAALFADKMRIMAGLYPWDAVVDVSPLPMARLFASGTPQASRYQQLRETIESARQLRRLLAPVFGLNPEGRQLRRDLATQANELYLTCFHHPDVQLMYGLFPSADKIYTPHGFDSLSLSESNYYAAVCSAASGGVLHRLREAADFLKKILFGPDAVLPKRLRVDAAYSFNIPMPWARIQHDLRPYFSRNTFVEIYARLPAEIKAYYEDLARQCGESTALLLLAPFGSTSLGEAANEAYVLAIVKLARRMSELEGSTSLLIKPHPRNSEDQIRAVVDRIAAALPKIRMILVREHSEYPIEIVLAPFPIRACGGFGTSSLRTLKRIYGTINYSPEADLLDLYVKHLPYQLTAAKIWIEDNRQEYQAV